MDKKRIIQALQELKNETYFQQSAENFQYVFILIYTINVEYKNDMFLHLLLKDVMEHIMSVVSADNGMPNDVVVPHMFQDYDLTKPSDCIVVFSSCYSEMINNLNLQLSKYTIDFLDKMLNEVNSTTFTGTNAEEESNVEIKYAPVEKPLVVTEEHISTIEEPLVETKPKATERLNPNYIIQSYLKNANSCEKCGNSSWMGYQIPLKISFKDDTMEALCPNCFAIFGVDNEK